jgi:hypothetical protein
MFSFSTSAICEVYSSETLSYLVMFSPLRKCGRALHLGQMKMSTPLWGIGFSSNPERSLHRGFISWGVSGMPALTYKGAIFNGLYFPN